MSGKRNAKSADNNTKAKGPKVDYVAVVLAAVKVFLTDGNAEALATVYRSVPKIARTKPMTVGMKAAGTKMAEVLDIFEGVGNEKSASTSRVKVTVDDSTKSLILVAAVVALVHGFTAEADVTNLHAIAMANADLFDSTFAKVKKLVEGVSVGNDRAHNPVTLKMLVEAGTIPAGTKLTGPNKAEAVVNADGTVTYQGKKVALSAAASTAKKHQQNGWDFWKMDGSLIGPLRDSHIVPASTS